MIDNNCMTHSGSFIIVNKSALNMGIIYAKITLFRVIS